MEYCAKTAAAAIDAALQKELSLSAEAAREVGFHMTDWLDDFTNLQEFFEAPEKFSSAQLSKLLMGFLIHVPNHVAAASKLVTGMPISDVFEVGIFDEDEDLL